MNEGSERLLEATGEFDRRQRERTIKRIREGLTLKGDAFCRDCGDPIDVARRMALPSATRCIECQTASERGRR